MNEPQCHNSWDTNLSKTFKYFTGPHMNLTFFSHTTALILSKATQCTCTTMTRFHAHYCEELKHLLRYVDTIAFAQQLIIRSNNEQSHIPR